MNINSSTKIYLCAPTRTFTGGPMCMHQLGFFLMNKLNLNVFMLYVPQKRKYENLNNPIHDNFKHFNLKFVKQVEDEENNIIISPEDFFFLNYIRKYTRIKKMIWWLSLDNHYPSFYHVNFNKFTRFFINLPFYFIQYFNKITNKFDGISTYGEYTKYLYKKSHKKDLSTASNVILNLSQSYYVHQNLTKLHYKSKLLYDYLEDKFFDDINFKGINKENIICFNPAKATNFIRYFIKKNKQFRFVPLINLSRTELLNTLLKSKIYIDFGSHPGRDKIPREAILTGNCILTNKKGSAKNSIDVSIPDRFKFEETKNNMEILKNTIENILSNYKQEFEHYLPYFFEVKNGKRIFEKQAIEIFKKKSFINEKY